MKKIYIPFSLYNEIIKDPNFDSQRISELAKEINIDKAERVILIELSGMFDKLIIYKVIEYKEINIPIEIHN